MSLSVLSQAVRARETERDVTDKMTAGLYFSLPLWPSRGHEPGDCQRKRDARPRERKGNKAGFNV